MKTFLKGIIVGIGGISPGLSGSVLLIIFGLYQKTLDALGCFFKSWKKNISFLFPLLLGMLTGVVLFSKIINFFISNYEMPTSFCFLGLILGTIPTVWQEVNREKLNVKHYIIILISTALGFLFFKVNPDTFPQITDPTILQCVLLGVAVAATAIIPGVDPAVFLSTFGLYRMYVAALADFDLAILAPMGIGLILGALVISFGMSYLFKRFYSVTYSIVFGIFLSMIPNMLTDQCILGWNGTSAISLALLLVGFAVSFVLGKRKPHSSAA